jgi:hypothetical protein
MGFLVHYFPISCHDIPWCVYALYLERASSPTNTRYVCYSTYLIMELQSKHCSHLCFSLILKRRSGRWDCDPRPVQLSVLCLQNKNGVLHPCTLGCTTGRIPKRTFNYLTSHLVSEWRSSVAPLCHSILCLLRGRMAAPKLHTGMRTIARARIVGMWGSPSKPASPAAPMSTQACLMHEPQGAKE